MASQCGSVQDWHELACACMLKQPGFVLQPGLNFEKTQNEKKKALAVTEPVE